MSKIRLLALITVSLGVLALPACGGGGQGLRVQSDPVLVTSTSVPAMLSGEAMDHVIPIEGGCGGPYVLQVIEGDMPKGLYLDNDTHAIMGNVLEDGDFDFTVQVTDTGCNPFSSTTARFQMQIGVGEIVVVGATLDGNPVMVPPGGESYNPDHPAIGSVVYNDYVTIELVVAGGKGPWSAVVFDDPDIPDDGPLPLGASIPPSSTSITGAPVEVGPGGGPFKVTLEITDSIGGKGYFTFYWVIETPPIIIATDSLGNGVCGEQYSDTFLAVEGVPPFNHELVEQGLPEGYTSDVNPNPQDPNADVIYNPEDDAPPTVNPPGALNKTTAAIYPAPTDEGPLYNVSHSGATPEGLRVNEVTGAFFGIPRRRGTFEVHYHVTSTLVPNSFGQHARKSYTIVMAPAATCVQDPAYTLSGSPFAQTEPYNRIADFELGQPYNPDQGSPGLQFMAMGGVPYDGISDHPHQSQVDDDPVSEVEGAYEWSLDWGPDGQIPGTDFSNAGVLSLVDPTALATQGFQNLMSTVTDQALPLSLVNPVSEYVRVSVGPDVVVITESTTSFNGANGTSYTQDMLGLHDCDMTVKILLPFGSGAQVKPLSDTRDLPGTGTDQHTLDDLPLTITPDPVNGKLPKLLTSVDLLRVSANPTGWWQDSFNMNPRGARGMQHADPNKTRGYYGNGFGYNYSSGSYKSGYGAAPDSSSVELPKCTTPDSVVAEDVDLGVSKEGGKFYAFDSEDFIGVFIVRPNSKIYVPFAADKDNTWSCAAFGDNWHYGFDKSATTLTAGKVPQMSVSPDGRFAAMKLMPTVATYTYYSTKSSYRWVNNRSGDCKILLFTLTGEKIGAWGDQTWKVIDSGADGTTSTGELLQAASLTLTNSHLYYVCSNEGMGDMHSWREHYCYRFEVETNGASGALLSSSDSDWDNTSGGGWMQMPNGRIDQMFYNYSSGTYSNQSIYNTLNSDGYNGHEGSAAPHPFRVNAEGNACVIVAGPKTSSSSSQTGSDFNMHHVWIDYDAGSGPVLHKLSSTRRHHPHGGGRGYRLTSGPRNGYSTQSHQFGHYTGPTSALEVSDDGLKVAIVTNRKTGTIYHYDRQYDSYNYPSRNWNAREDIIAFEASDGADWGNGVDEIQVTGTESATASIFNNSPNIQWRFGALTFTQEGDGLIFWGGFSAYDPDYSGSTYSYNYGAHSFVGSLYAFDFDATTPTVYSILSSTWGGANLTIGTAYTSSTRIGSSSWISQWETDGGCINPIGGFISPNREYMYICNNGAISASSSNAQQHRLVGVNIKSLDGVTSTTDDHAEGRAFEVGNWPSRRGFLPTYGSSGGYPYHYYGVRYPYYMNLYGGHIVMAGETGRVFFGAHWQTYGPGRSTSSSYGGPVRATYTTYAYRGIPHAGQVAVFDSNVGGDVTMLTSLSETLNSNSYSSTTMRYMKYIEPSSDGMSVAYVWGGPSQYRYYMGHSREEMGYITNLEMDADGDVVGFDEIETVQSSIGRISTSVAHDSTGGGLFYGYVAGTSNENAKLLYQVQGNTGTSTDLGASAKRYNILNSGR